MPDQDPRDGQTTFIAGQDASQTADRISQAGFASGINVSTREGALNPRYAFIKKDLQFPSVGFEYRPGQYRPYADIFHGGKFQAMIPYQIGTERFVIVIVSGIVFLINQTTLVVETLELSDGTRLDELSPRINWSQAGRFLVLFDFPARPVIIEGRTIRRSKADAYEVPIATLGAYNQNRLFIANAGTEFTAGDPAGSLATPDAPVTFREIMGGGPYVGESYQVPSDYNNGPITALAILQATDDGTGIGTLIAGTRQSIYAYSTQNPRTAWQAGQFGKLIVYNAGIAGQRSFVNVNSDLHFLSTDGEVRSLSMSRDEQRKWTRVPMSREVKNWLKFKDPDLLGYSVMEYFNNSIFVTTNPFRTTATRLNGRRVIDIAFGGFCVLELDSVSRMGQESPPAWAGLWTGIRPMDFCRNGGRCFAMSKDGGFRNEFYEIDPKRTVDTDGRKRRQIRSVLETRGFMFESPFQSKELKSVELAFSDIRGKFSLEIGYKPSHGTEFLKWEQFDYEAPYELTRLPCEGEMNGFAPHSIKDLKLGSIEDEDHINPVTGDYLWCFKKMQLRLTINADSWQLHEYEIKAIMAPEADTYSVPKSLPVVAIPRGCNSDWAVENFR